MNILLKLYKLIDKAKRTLVSIWLSYLAGVSVEYISGSTSLLDLIGNVFDFSKLSVVILWSTAAGILVLYAFYILFDKIRVSQKIETRFKAIMKAHTFDVLNQSELGGYSWGYNKTLCVPNNPSGWKPEDIYIDLRGSQIDTGYRLDHTDTGLSAYHDSACRQYCDDSQKIAIIRARGDDMERYGVSHVEKSMKGNKVELRLHKTSWSQLQFSWDYLRRLDTRNQPVTHPTEDGQVNRLFVRALNHDGSFLINSFCLHLILVSNNGNVILSKISKVKSNDYPATWAATIGEQVERTDFLNDTTGELHGNFVVRWVKRALQEEFGIDENTMTEKGISELEEYTDMDSLRVLSLDFEGDIYNVALTCVLKLRIDTKRLQTIKAIQVDDNEMTSELKECTGKDVRSILMNYPGNSKQYHPSTYLRLLMYHLYSYKQRSTFEAFAKEKKPGKHTVSDS